MDLPRTAHTLLGFLTWGPMSGYDLKKRIDGSVKNFWSESYGQIYPTLRRLADAGLIEPTDEASDGRKRQVYAITEAGRAELRRWLEAAPERHPPRIELLLKLFFGSRIDPARCIEHVEAYRAEIEDDLARYDELRPPLEAASRTQVEPRFWLMTLRYGERSQQATLAWCEEALAELRAIQSGGDEA